MSKRGVSRFLTKAHVSPRTRASLLTQHHNLSTKQVPHDKPTEWFCSLPSLPANICYRHGYFCQAIGDDIRSVLALYSRADEGFREGAMRLRKHPDTSVIPSQFPETTFEATFHGHSRVPNIRPTVNNQAVECSYACALVEGGSPLHCVRRACDQVGGASAIDVSVRSATGTWRNCIAWILMFEVLSPSSWPTQHVTSRTHHPSCNSNERIDNCYLALVALSNNSR